MNLALFDFDGTITTHDTLIKFIRYAVGDVRFVLGMIVLSPMLTAYKLKFISNEEAKQRMLAYYFKGMPVETFRQIAKNYSISRIDKIVRPSAMERIVWHKEQGDEVVVVSASIECWLKPWCDKNELALLCTRMESSDGVITGRFATHNCHGAEKVHRVKAQYVLEDFDLIYAYGDSKGDKELLSLADKSFYRVFF